MNEKNYFRNRIASEDNMKLFETTTHIEWDWRIETLAHIAVRLACALTLKQMQCICLHRFQNKKNYGHPIKNVAISHKQDAMTI